MKVLIIKLKQIGDSILALPVCNTLRKSLPHAEIHFLVYEHIAPLFENHPSIDKLMTITPKERHSKSAFFKKLKQLRAEKYDAALDIINTPTSLLVTRFTGAKIQAGFVTKKLRSKFYPNKIYRLDEGAGRRKVPILKALNIPLAYDYSIEIPLPENEVQTMKNAIKHAGIISSRPLIAMMVYSRRDYKIWPGKYFVELSNHLINKYNAQLYFVSGPGEEEAVKQIANQVERKQSVFIRPEAPSTRDLACFLHCADFFIGNDGGPRHIAQAVGKATFSIFSPRMSKRDWIPDYPDPEHQAIDISDIETVSQQKQHIENNLKEYYLKITPEMVIERLDKMLENREKFVSDGIHE